MSVDLFSDTVSETKLNESCEVLETTERQLENLTVEESFDEVELVPVCVVFGGMDTEGNVFNDFLVIRIDSFS